MFISPPPPQFKSQEAAVATRNRLHGLKWPSTNPKLLAADFLTAEEVHTLTDGDMSVSVSREEQPGEEGDGVMEVEPVTSAGSPLAHDEEKTMEGEYMYIRIHHSFYL